jgi:hypothetical protein
MDGDGPTYVADAQKGNEFAIEYLKKAPRLLHPLYWEAFNDLSTERNSGGMGIGPIPRSAMRQYADEELGLTRPERDAFMWIIRQLDIKYLNNQAAKLPSK